MTAEGAAYRLPLFGMRIGPLPARPPGADWCTRTDSNMPCEICGEPWRRHLYDWGEVSYDGGLYLFVACGGRRIKG